MGSLDEIGVALRQREMEVEWRIHLARGVLISLLVLTDVVVSARSGRAVAAMLLFLPPLLAWGAGLYFLRWLRRTGAYWPSLKYQSITIDAAMFFASSVAVARQELYRNVLGPEGLAGTVMAGAVALNTLGALRMSRAAIVFSGVVLGLGASATAILIGRATPIAVLAVILLAFSTALNLSLSGAFTSMFLHVWRRDAMMRFLPRAVVDGIDSGAISLDPGGTRRTVTFLMADIRGFTVLSEELPPERVVAFLNGYLERMIALVMDHGGTIIDIIGDAVFAVFGAPEHRTDDALRGLECALAMQLGMESIAAAQRQHGLGGVEMGIGVHRGEVVVGNIGTRSWMKYGVVGRHVNLTSRIESYTVGGQVLASQAVVDAAGEAVTCGRSLTVTPKGVAGPVTLHDVIAVRGRTGLALRPQGGAPFSLPAPARVRINTLDGKKGDGTTLDGRIIAMDGRSATLEAPHPMETLANVKLELTSGAVLYGKVVHPDPEPPCYRVRFTALSPEAEAAVRLMIPPGSGG